MDLLNYLAPVGGRGGGGIISRIAGNSAKMEQLEKAEADRAKKGMAMAEAMRKLADVKSPRERVDVMADYAQQGYDFNDLRGFNKPDHSGIKSVQGGLYDMNSGGWVVPPKADKRGYGHLKSLDGGLYNMDAGSWEVEPDKTAKKPNYSVGASFPEDFEAEIAAQLGLEDDQYLDPDLLRKMQTEAAEQYSNQGNFPNAVSGVLDKYNMNADSLEEYETEGNWNPFKENKSFMRRKVETPQASSVTRTGAGRGSGMVVVSNGSETLRIDPNDLPQAQAEGYEVMY